MNAAAQSARISSLPSPTHRGRAAVEAARAGAHLYVLNPQVGWVRGDAATLVRAERLLAEGAEPATWVYGA